MSWLAASVWNRCLMLLTQATKVSLAFIFLFIFIFFIFTLFFGWVLMNVFLITYYFFASASSGLLLWNDFVFHAHVPLRQWNSCSVQHFEVIIICFSCLVNCLYFDAFSEFWLYNFSKFHPLAYFLLGCILIFITTIRTPNAGESEDVKPIPIVLSLGLYSM